MAGEKGENVKVHPVDVEPNDWQTLEPLPTGITPPEAFVQAYVAVPYPTLDMQAIW